MTTSAKAAFGIQLSKDGTAIAEVTNLTGPSRSGETIDVSNHDSPDTFREFVAGMRDGGEISMEGNFIPGDEGQAALLTDYENGTLVEYVLTFPTAMGTTETFNALVTALDLTNPYDDKSAFSATLKISGKPVRAVTASTGLTDPYFTISESAVIVPAAAGDTYTYVATVLTGVTSVTVTPTATAGVITVDGNTVATGEASSAITLGDAGTVTEITIVVKETNKTAKTYTIYLTRAAS